MTLDDRQAGWGQIKERVPRTIDTQLGGSQPLTHRVAPPAVVRPFISSFAAVQVPSVSLSPQKPKILSAIKKSRRTNTPDMNLSGGESFLTSLRNVDKIPPQLGNQPSFHITCLASPGRIGVDSKTGAAIQRPVIPGGPLIR